MGEIKSTWDIVLEKTRGMEITSGDRERIKREGLASKIHATFHGYMDARGNQEYLQGELKGLRVEEREVIERELFLTLVDAVDLSKDNDKVITGGGIVGTVTKVIDEHEVMVEIADGVKVRVQRGMISGVMSKTEPVKGDKGGDKSNDNDKDGGDASSEGGEGSTGSSGISKLKGLLGRK